MSEAASVSGRSASSSQEDATKYLRKKHQNANSQEEEDLLEQKRTLQEAVFTSMYTLVKAKHSESWKVAVVKTALEGLIPLLVLLNPHMGWPIATNNPLWQVVRWVLPRVPVTRIWTYAAYVRLLYALVALIFGVLAAIALFTLSMHKQEPHSRWLRRFGSLLQTCADLTFTTLYVAIFDFLTFPFNCRFGRTGNHHTYWTTVECLAGSHVIVLAVAGTTAAVALLATALMAVASSELNPVARGILASPAAVTRMRILVLKAIFVCAAHAFHSWPKVQAIAMLIAATGTTWLNFSELPFLRNYVNYAWVGQWAGITLTAVVHTTWAFNKRRREDDVARRYLHMVLYGIFPVVAGGAGVTWAWVTWRLRPAVKFREVPDNTKLRKIHKFGEPEEVEVLARVMRRFNSDGLVFEESAALGETIIKAGMAVFPGHVGLLVLYANYLMEVRGDGPAARTHLQLALKGGPSLIQRYQIFYTIENSKRLKDGQEGALDLQSYVEFKRNYRAVIRVHKAALTAQREFWQLLQRSAVRMSAVEEALRGLDRATQAAQQVYLRVLERYPSNGKLLRCYGKFLEDVKNDPAAAARAYVEAARNGGSDGLLSLDLKIQGSDKPEFLTSMDLHEDACIVINAQGIILMVNACVTTLLGYSKAELEGANVSIIVPQPFASRHDAYLLRYVQSSEGRILDTVRDVVAQHKERYVFPLQICVTKLSGVGSDSVFLGILRPAQMDSYHVRAWVAPNGVILCADPQFASLTGLTAEEMVGRNFQTLCTDMASVEALLDLCRESPYEALVSGSIVRRFDVVHKYLPPVPVDIRVTAGGTDSQRVVVFNAHRTDGNGDGLLVVDSKGAVNFATWDVAALLGYPLTKFLKMKVDQLLPQPFATMHAKHLKDQPTVVPPSSCRAGSVVHMVNSNGVNVPVRLHITTKDDPVSGRVDHVIQVTKVDTAAQSRYRDKRLVLTVSLDGTVLSVDQPHAALFGFQAGAAVGVNLADCIDVFAEWRDRVGTQQLELLLLSLLDKENEMPGTSWRVKVHSPDSEDHLPPIDPKAAAAGAHAHRHSNGRSAFMQAEEEEEEQERGGLGDGDEDHLHRRARSQTDFVAQWVRVLSRHMTTALERYGANPGGPTPGRGPALADASAAAAGASFSSAAGGGGGGQLLLRHQVSGAGSAGRGAAAVRSPSLLGRAGAAASPPPFALPGGGVGVVGVDVLQLPTPRGSASGVGGGAGAGGGGRRGVKEQPSIGTIEEEEGEGEEGGDHAHAHPHPQPHSHHHHHGGKEEEGHGGEEEEEEDDEEDDAMDAEIRRRLSKMESNLEMTRAQSGASGLTGDDGEGLEGAGGTGGGGAGGGGGGFDDDDGASQSGGPDYDGASAMDLDIGVDARRNRLLKRMMKALAGPFLAEPLSRLHLRTLLLLAVMVLSHAVCYVVLVNLVNLQFGNVRAVHRMALAADRCQLAVFRAQVASFCSQQDIANVSVCEAPLADTLSDLTATLDDLEVYHQAIYLGEKAVPRTQSDSELHYTWTSKTQSYKLYMDVADPHWTNLTAGVWQLGNRFIAAGRELLWWGASREGDISALRPFRFLLSNGPWSLFSAYSVSLDYLTRSAWEDITSLQKAILALLVIEAALVQLACICAQWFLVRRVELGRRGGLLAGLGLPGPILRVLASKPLVVLEDSDNEDGDDEEGEMGGDGGGDGGTLGGGGGGGDDASNPHSFTRQMSSASGVDDDDNDNGNGRRSLGGGGKTTPHHASIGPTSGADERAASVLERVGIVGGGVGAHIGGRRGAVVRPGPGGRVQVNGKVLSSSLNHVIKFMAPLVLWEVALMVVLAVTYNRLDGMQDPLSSLNMASRVIYRYTRVRMASFLLVSGATPADRSQWRSVLATEVANLESEYDTLMYGGLSTTQIGTVFEHPVPASTFESVSFASNYFKDERCFRWDQSQCYKPDSPYYEVTHHGLDVMMRRIISEMGLLVQDADADAVYNGTRYTTMYMVGMKDLYEGLQSSAQLFMDYMLSRYNLIKTMHSILLIVSILLVLSYALLILRPYRAAVEREAERLAGLLSHVPAEMDVVSHVRQVLRAHARLYIRTRAVVRQVAITSEDGTGAGGGPMGQGGRRVSGNGMAGSPGRRVSLQGNSVGAGGLGKAAGMRNVV
ncbi:hypothetical protein Agub_g14007 [Astrephomene gubernaculifera]|uniref:PAS domain-containing protein n=1 Tax=Astrephomene gubernaculifera TaxID=47775 RepID=A0AAD3E507_9CHLO|nr:hypothetical protein Agub_g14007 [Astrephomene gubernaculifera]